jgi:hypothetical protein
LQVLAPPQPPPPAVLVSFGASPLPAAAKQVPADELAPPRKPVADESIVPAIVTVPFATNTRRPPVCPFHTAGLTVFPLPIVTLVYCGTRTACARLGDVFEYVPVSGSPSVSVVAVVAVMPRTSHVPDVVVLCVW